MYKALKFDMRKVQQYLGHSNVNTTMAYLKSGSEDVNEAVGNIAY
jgi:site-specific recombinase XerD